MLIEITYNVTDVFMSTTETPVYVEISFEQPGGSAAVWGSITGTLSNQTDLQNALNLKVPYTGATTNVNLGEYELKAGQVTLDTSPTGTAAVGTIRWNDTTGTSETTLKGGNVIIKNGVDLVARVVNKVSPNTTLTKAAYQAVRVSGAQGQRLAIELAQANNDAGSADTIGLVTETIAPNQEGFIMTVGQLEGINTTGSLQGETWVDGDVLYLSPTTAGALTNIKPTAVTGHIVVIGYVEYAHANNGKIYVKVMNGWELDELHNVSIVTPTNNQGLFYNSTSTLWENKSITTALGYTPVPTTRNITINGVTYDLSADRTYTISAGISGSGASGQVTYWTGASAVSGSNNLFWDNTNGRLGIGTNAPSATLTVAGGITLSSGSLSLPVAIHSVFGGSYRFWNRGSNRWTFEALNANIGFEFKHIMTSGNAFHIVNTSDTSQFLVTGDGNVGIGVTPTVRLQVSGDTLLRGSGNTNTTTALTVQNSSSTDIFRVRNDGQVGVNSVSNFIGRTIELYGATSTNIAYTYIGGVLTTTTGSSQSISIGTTFQPTSGASVLNTVNVAPAINQTGGANGITRGLYVNPTLTAAADFRAIETTAGNVLFGSNFFWNNTNARLGIGIATPAVSLDVRTSAVGELAYFANTAANSGLIIGTQTNVGYISSVSSLSALGFGINGTTTAIRIFTNSNVSINNNVDLGVRFSVVGDTRLIGSGATLATTALTVQNSSSTNLFSVRNDGLATFGGDISINASSSSPSIQVQSNTSSTVFDGNAQGSGTVAFELRNSGIRRFRILGTATNTTFESSNQTGSFIFNNLVSLPASTTSKSSLNIASGTAPTTPNNGDIWFDGTDIKMRIGGVTKTFTLI